MLYKVNVFHHQNDEAYMLIRQIDSKFSYKNGGVGRVLPLNKARVGHYFSFFTFGDHWSTPDPPFKSAGSDPVKSHPTSFVHFVNYGRSKVIWTV